MRTGTLFFRFDADVILNIIFPSEVPKEPEKEKEKEITEPLVCYDEIQEELFGCLNVMYQLKDLPGIENNLLTIVY